MWHLKKDTGMATAFKIIRFPSKSAALWISGREPSAVFCANTVQAGWCDCNFCLADKEWWLTTWAPKETGKWVMLTLFASFNWCVPVASQSKHTACVFPWMLLMLDESSTVVDHHVCVKPLPAKVSPTYHVSSTSALGFFVSIKIMAMCS